MTSADALQRMVIVAFLGCSIVGFIYSLWAGLFPPLWLLRNGLILGGVCAGMNYLRTLLSVRIGSALSPLFIGTFLLGYGIMSDTLEPYFTNRMLSLAKLQFGCVTILTTTVLWLSLNCRPKDLEEKTP